MGREKWNESWKGAQVKGGCFVVGRNEMFPY